ncbi:hypothetical protein ACLOJK_031340 [Asimina triloba]
MRGSHSWVGGLEEALRDTCPKRVARTAQRTSDPARISVAASFPSSSSGAFDLDRPIVSSSSAVSRVLQLPQCDFRALAWKCGYSVVDRLPFPESASYIGAFLSSSGTDSLKTTSVCLDGGGTLPRERILEKGGSVFTFRPVISLCASESQLGAEKPKTLAMASPSENNSMPQIDIDAAAPEEEETSHLFRQPSVYSLTLDEFQNTVCEPGKSFGSMNMDEFIANIWTVEESQAVAAAMEAAQANPNPTDGENIMPQIGRQPSLHKQQSSLTIPAPLSRKTVEEVWAEIHRDKGAGPDQQVDSSAAAHHGTASSNSQPNDGNSKGGSAARQPTFGEMTLEDFLIKAGVVREDLGSFSPSKQQPQPQQYGYLSRNNINGTEPADYSMSSGNHVMSRGYNAAANGGGAAHARGVQAYQAFPQQQQAGAAVGEGMSNYSGGSAGRNGIFPGGGCFGGRMGNGGSMAGSGFGVGCGSPVMSPMPSDGVCGGSSQGVDNSVGQYGLEMEMGGGSTGVVRGSASRKRGGEGESVEKGVERRQRRMIKNRESAARSRARKQAYTVELEAELEMLKEENARLRREHEEEEAKRKKKMLEAVMANSASAKGMKPKPLRRTFTGPW